IEHLNRFGQFYIPEIKQRIAHSKIGPSETFKSGLLGNYFAKSMLPKPDMKKMKSPKAMNPQNSKLSRDVLDTFLHQQEQLLKLLERAKSIDLTKTKASTSLSKIMKFRLGD